MIRVLFGGTQADFTNTKLLLFTQGGRIAKAVAWPKLVKRASVYFGKHRIGNIVASIPIGLGHHNLCSPFIALAAEHVGKGPVGEEGIDL